MMLLSEEKKQGRLTDWYKEVKNSSVDERTSVCSQDLFKDSNFLEQGDSTLNKLVAQHTLSTACDTPV